MSPEVMTHQGRGAGGALPAHWVGLAPVAGGNECTLILIDKFTNININKNYNK